MTTLLSAPHAHHLDSSAISADVQAERGYRTVSSRHEWRLFDSAMPDRQVRVPGLAFPVFRLGIEPAHAWVLRPDAPRMSKSAKPKAIKYEWPAGIPPCLDLLPRYRPLLADPSVPIWITEGAKKADALATLYDGRVIPVNLNGVWGWRGTSGTGGKLVLPDMDEVAWNGRTVVLAFDSDVVKKRAVLTALQRLAAVLSTRGVEDVHVLMLPQQGDKVGVDDYLADGHDAAELEAHLFPLAQAVASGRDKLFTHPQTGAELYLPPGYLANDMTQSLSRMDAHGQASVIYPGLIAVSATGTDLDTGTETLTVRWNGRGDHHGELTAPRADLARAKGVIEHLAARGAAVHDGNARDVARFLIEFAHENTGALPHVAHLDRLGIHEAGVLLPAGGVGFTETVQYGGRPVQVGADADAYPRALRSVAADWRAAWAFWLVLGITLAAPAIARLRLRRNPALYIAGESGTGKTTLAQFCVGCWGDPTHAPFLAQANDSTPVAIAQTIDRLRGLPLLVDEAHTTRFPEQLESLAYRFANGESRLYGTVDRQTRGGEAIGGALLLCGEALPEFRHAGSTRRVLWIDGTVEAPLGAGTIGRPGSAAYQLGEQRAHLLEQAWEAGAGLFGKAVAEIIWRDWDAFVAEVQMLREDVALQPLQAWREPLAAAAAALNVAFRCIGATEAPASFDTILDQWSAMLTRGHERSDPAVEAWERLVLMLARADETTSERAPGWIIAEDRRTHRMLACQRVDSGVWRVLTGTEEFTETVGKAAVQLYGRAWARRGWVVERNGQTSKPDYLPNGMTARVLHIPSTALETWNDEGVRCHEGVM